MKFISHRGNIFGIEKDKENTIYQAEKAIQEGYDIELDIWYWKDKWWLGHDYPHNEIDFGFVKDYGHELWLHCKDVNTFYELNSLTATVDINTFMNDKDIVALTSKRYFWTYNNGQLTNMSIAVMPEHPCNNWSIEDISKCAGICTDYPYHWKELLSRK